MVLVVEPLTSLMADQVERATSMNLQPASLLYHRDLCSDDFKSVVGASISDTDKKLYSDICTGKHNVELHQPRIFCIAVLHLYQSNRFCNAFQSLRNPETAVVC